MQIYSAFNITIFIIVFCWFFQTYIFLALITFGVLDQSSLITEAGEDTIEDKGFRNVDGELAYIPYVNRIELADDCLAADVTGLPFGRFPTPVLTVSDVQKSGEKAMSAKERRASKLEEGAAARGEILTVVAADEFKFLSKDGAATAATLKNIFSSVTHYEPTGFNTRVENLGTGSSIFGSVLGKTLGGGMDAGLKGLGSGIGAVGKAFVGAGPTASRGGPANSEPAGPLVLPPNWEEKTTPEGKKYYVNHATKKTQWVIPKE